MTKRIAAKYTFLINAVITAVMLVFIPLYTFMQNSIFIDIEKKTMIEFYESFKANTNLSDKAQIENFIEDNNEKDYAIAVFDKNQKVVYSTRKRFKNDKSSTRQNTDNINSETKTNDSLNNDRFEYYSPDAVPVFKDQEENDRESITLRAIASTKNGRYYVLIRESLRNSASFFSYTNNVLIIISAAYILACGLILFLLMRKLTKSIRSLNAVVQKVAQKDYSVRYKGKITKDEIGTLSKNLNEMVDTIQNNINSISNYNFLLKEDIENLKEYEDMRSKFVRNVTHELKTPLAIVSSQVEMMNCTADEEKRQYYYNSAMEEIQKISTLITEFLKYSSSSHQSIKIPEATTVDLSEKITELCKKIKSTTDSKHLRLSYSVERGFRVKMPEIHIEHIFNNYIMNAIKFTAPHKSIRVELKNVKGVCRLSVYNDGDQISEENLEKIWTEFYTKNNSSTENVGLGLFIVKEISVINSMKCGVTNRDKGVEFWFDFN